MPGTPKKYYFGYDHDMIDKIPNILGRFIVRDMDADGDEDILVSGFGTDGRWKLICFEKKVRLRQLTTESWLKGGRQTLARLSWSRVIPMDVNGDGLVDFVCFPTHSDKKPILLLNTSKPSNNQDK